jgi:26S proteasome regulatory subunit N1
MAPKDSTAVPMTASTGDKKKEDAKKKKEEEIADAMSEEDKELKERLETCVSTVLNDKEETLVTIPIRSNALDIIVNELRTATSSMTSVPKPLKFLRPHFGTVKAMYLTMEKLTDMDDGTVGFRARLADLLAVLAMTMGKPGTYLYDDLHSTLIEIIIWINPNFATYSQPF